MSPPWIGSAPWSRNTPKDAQLSRLTWSGWNRYFVASFLSLTTTAVIAASLSTTVRLFQLLSLLQKEKLLGISLHRDMSGLIFHCCSLPHFNLVNLLEISLHATFVSMKTVTKHKRRNIRVSWNNLRAGCKSSDTAWKDGNEKQIYLKFPSYTDTA